MVIPLLYYRQSQFCDLKICYRLLMFSSFSLWWVYSWFDSVITTFSVNIHVHNWFQYFKEVERCRKCGQKNWKLSTDSDVFKLNRGSFIAVAETHGGYRISPFRSLKVYDFCILVWFVTRGDFFIRSYRCCHCSSSVKCVPGTTQKTSMAIWATWNPSAIYFI